MTIYLDHNATTPVLPGVRAAISRLLVTSPANPSSLHQPGQRARRLLDEARADVAEAVGAQPDQIYFTSGGTEANILALSAVAGASQRPRIAVSAVEHPSVIEAAESICARYQKELLVLPVLTSGHLDLDRARQLLDGSEALVSVMLANHETGARQPVELLLRLVRERGGLLHVDAAQALGRLPFSFTTLGADLLTCSGHKIGAPQGIGALVVRPGIPLKAPVRAGDQQRGLRPGTENLMGAVGMAAACRTVADRQLSQRTRLAGLRDHLDSRLRAAIPDATRLTPTGDAALCQTLNIIFPDADGEALVEELSQRGVAVSTGSACSAGRSEPSHVLLAMGVPPELARCALRFSLGHGTSMGDIERAASAVIEAVAAVRAHMNPELAP